MKEEMNEFQISGNEMECLKHVMSGDESLADLLKSQKSAPSGKTAMCLTRPVAEQVRERLTIELAARGFDENHSPHDLGRMLENLIDRFFVA
jgi:hypothetical protein